MPPHTIASSPHYHQICEAVCQCPPRTPSQAHPGSVRLYANAPSTSQAHLRYVGLYANAPHVIAGSPRGSPVGAARPWCTAPLQHPAPLRYPESRKRTLINTVLKRKIQESIWFQTLRGRKQVLYLRRVHGCTQILTERSQAGIRYLRRVHGCTQILAAALQCTRMPQNVLPALQTSVWCDLRP